MIAVEDHLTLYRGNRVIEISHLGRARTRADLMASLPQENILITGELVVYPVPLIGSTSYPAGFAASLERLLALRPSIIIPGHGPIMRDDSYVRQELRLLASLKQQVESTIARGENLEQTRRSVNLDEFRRLFAADSQARGFIFDNYVTASGIPAAFQEATARRQ